jgi:hypothetical protein
MNKNKTITFVLHATHDPYKDNAWYMWIGDKRDDSIPTYSSEGYTGEGPWRIPIAVSEKLGLFSAMNQPKHVVVKITSRIERDIDDHDHVF